LPKEAVINHGEWSVELRVILSMESMFYIIGNGGVDTCNENVD